MTKHEFIRVDEIFKHRLEYKRVGDGQLVLVCRTSTGVANTTASRGQYFCFHS